MDNMIILNHGSFISLFLTIHIQVEVPEEKSEYVYLDTIEEEPESKKEDEEIGDITDNIEAIKRKRTESGVTSASSASGTRSRTDIMAAPFMGQVMRAFQRQMSGANLKRSRRPRRSSRGGLGTPRSSECEQGMTLLSNSSSLRSNKSEASSKSGNQDDNGPETETLSAKTDVMVKSSPAMENKDTSEM